MRSLELNGFSPGKFSSKYQKVLSFLEKGDFRAAQVKKLRNHDIYRAKLDDAARLLFKIASCGEEKVLLILELLTNHDYDKSRFLRGIQPREDEFEDIPAHDSSGQTTSIRYLNPQAPVFHYLHTPLSFDDQQQRLLECRPPLVIIGSAGCGKTVLTLEKMKELTGQILYVTLSPYLTEHSRNLYFSSGFESDHQEVDFLSFRDLIETIRVPAGKEMTYDIFAPWFHRVKQNFGLKDAHKVFEEIRGVITGSSLENGFLSRSEYEGLGVRQSIFSAGDRTRIYGLFERCLDFQKTQNLYDPNIVAFEYSKLAESKYDFAVIDEVQDLTLPQLKLIMNSLRSPSQFMMCGDSNQVVHPNFFSWANIRRLFYHESANLDFEVIHILQTNYRNSKRVTDLSNRLLLLKQKRFGSTDRESNYLIESCASSEGVVEILELTDKMRRDIDTKISKSARFAVVVLRDEDKAQAQQWFSTPLVFSIHEAKGLEYENIVLCNLVSSCEKEFREIVAGIGSDDLKTEMVFSRTKNKEDKSLEEYKFFINSLYVALTRATNRVYLLESKPDHPLFRVLELGNVRSEMTMKAQESSREDWQREARRLDLQGKTDQANQIRSRILGTKPVPWRILNSDTYAETKSAALSTKFIDKKAQQALFEYALQYAAPQHFAPLVAARFSYAREPEKNLDYVFTKLYGPFLERPGQSTWKSMVEQYGVDFRGPLNETPLMMAVKTGNETAVKTLLDLGAKPELQDNVGMTAFQNGLRTLMLSGSRHCDHQKVAHCLALVSPAALKVKVLDKMYKLDAKSAEYFMIQSLYSIFPTLISNQVGESGIPAFKATTIDDYFRSIPSIALPEHRKRRTYINAILAKNETQSNHPYNRNLFVRLRVGYYLFNPALELEVAGQWVNIYEHMQLQLFDGRLHTNVLIWLEKSLMTLRERLTTGAPARPRQEEWRDTSSSSPSFNWEPSEGRRGQSILGRLLGRQK